MAKAKKKDAVIAEDVLTAEELAAIEDVSNVEEEDIVAAVVEVETKEAKKKIHEATKVEEPASKKATPKKAKAKAKKAATPATPRMSLDSHKASEIILARAGSVNFKDYGLDQKACLATIDLLDKKTREKAINLFHCMATGRAPSTYTVQAAKFGTKKGAFTQKELTDHFLETGYQIGTARRQAGEMVALFPAVGMGNRGKTRGAPVIIDSESKVLKFILEAATPKSS